MEELAEPLISVTERLGEIAESRFHHLTLWRTRPISPTNNDREFYSYHFVQKAWG